MGKPNYRGVLRGPVSRSLTGLAQDIPAGTVVFSDKRAGEVCVSPENIPQLQFLLDATHIDWGENGDGAQ